MFLKRNQIDEDGLVEFINNGGQGQVPSELIEQLVSLLSAPKKDPTRYEAEVIRIITVKVLRFIETDVGIV